MTSIGIRNIRLGARTAIAAFLLLAMAVAVLTYALPALAQEPDPDGTREGAVSLGAQSPDKGRQFFYDKSLDKANGDGVDYYTFTTDDRYTLGLGARDQTVELKVALEDADGSVVGVAGPPSNPDLDQVYIEWLKVTIDAGTYYVRVEALEDDATDYYIRFGLEDAPNSAPAFGSASYSFSIAEDAAASSAVGSVSATDDDDDTLTYTIESGNGDGKFAIDGSTGAITAAGALDHETTPSYTLTVQADDGNDGTDTATVTVTVTDVDENNAPEFGSATYSFSVAEDASTGAAVGSVSATDADSDDLTYSITAGNGDGKFAIDGSTGAITTAGALDHETTPSYALTVQADDDNGGTDTATVTVTVTDVEESTTGPLTGFTLVDASDQTVLATLVGGDSVELADPDGGSYGIRADLEDGETAGSVRLELSGTKAVSRTENVAPYSLYGDGGANALHGEALPAGGYTVTATAYAEAGLADDKIGTLEVSFTVTQANRSPSFGSSTYSFSIAEDASTGAAVGSVSATDADSDGITYTIEAGNGDSKFTIDGSTGAITVAGALDHELTPSYTLTVQADDGEGGTDTATVTVTVTDVDENNAPEFGSSTYSFSVAEDASTGAAVGSVSATDADSDDLTYSITAGNGDSKFTIDGSSGAITVAGALDHGTTPSYTLTVQADDGNDGTDTATVTVTDVDENNAPEFGSATYSFSVAEDASTGAAVGSVSATDADSDDLTYSITAGNGDGKFAIDGSTGAITTAGALDHETTPSYALTVQADDDNGGTDTATVTVTVTDVEESTTGPLTGFTLVDASDQTVLATLVGGDSVELADPDGGSYGIRADLEDGETAGSVRLELSGTKAVSRTENVAPYSLYGDGGANALHGEALPAGGYTVTATAYAEAGLADDKIGTLEVSFTVTQANRSPSFGSSTYSFSIAEDASTGAAVGSVSATDADSDGITYTIEAGNGDSKFTIDGSTGAITVAGALDHGTTPSYALTVQADDDNGGTDTATVTVTVTEVEENTQANSPQENADPLTSVVAPENLSVKSLTHQSATLTWQVPAQPALVSVTEMSLERAEGSGSFNHSQSVSTDLNTFGSSDWQKKITGLSKMTEYRFRVKLETDGGDVYSNELTLTTNATQSPGGTPDAPDITALHSGIFEVDWNDIDRTQYYEVRYWNNSRAAYVVLPGEGIEIEFDGSRAIVRNLSPNLRYYAFEVQAVNSVAESGWSEYGILWNENWDFSGVPVPERLTEPEPDPEPVGPVLNAPVNLAGKATHESVILSWEAPAQPEGLSVTGMLLEVAGTDGAIIYSDLVATELDESQSSSWERVVGGLSSGVEYRSRVSLYTDSSIAFSDVLRVTTHSDPPALPNDLRGLVTHESVLLTWTMPEQPDWVEVEHLEIGRTPAMAEGAGRLEWQEGGGEYQYTDDYVSANTPYLYEVRLVTAAGTYSNLAISLTTDHVAEFSNSDGNIITGTPGPTSLEAWIIDRQHVTLTWTKPAGITPTGYQILRREEGVDDAGVFPILVMNTASTATSYDDVSVEPETTYEYQVKAIDGTSLTTASNSVTITTPIEPAFTDVTDLDVDETPQRTWHTHWDAMDVSTVKVVSPVVPVYMFTLDSASQVSFEVETGGWESEYFPGSGSPDWYRLTFDVRDERGNVLVRSKPKEPNNSVITRYLGATLDAGTYYLVSWAPPGQLYCPGSCASTKKWKIAVEYWLEQETNADDTSSGAVELDVSDVENISKYFFGMLDRGEGDGSDYFKFTIDGKTLVKLSLEAGQDRLRYEVDGQPNYEVNASLRLENSEGEQLATTTGLADGTPIMFTLDSAGTYYIRVSSLDDDNNLYKFKFGLFNLDYAPTVTATLDVTEAAKSEQRREVTMAEDDHEDFFTFTIKEVKDVGVGLTGLDSNFDVDLISEYGRTLHTSAYSGTSGEWMRHVLEPGKYYVRVHRDSSSASEEAGYTLRFHLDPATWYNTPQFWQNPATWYTRYTEFLLRRWGDRHWRAPDLPVFPEPLSSVVYENDDTFSSDRDLDRIALEWDLPDAGGATVTRYTLQRSEDRGSTWSDIHGSTTSFTSFNDKHVQPNEDYRYRMKLETDDGDVYSSVHIATVGGRIFTTNLRATEITHDSLKLEWDMPFEDEDVEGYLILDSKLRDGSFRILVLSTRTKDTSYVLRNLSPERTYGLMVIPIIDGDWASEVGYSDLRVGVSENPQKRTTREVGATVSWASPSARFSKTDAGDFRISWFFSGTGSASGYEVERTTRYPGGTETRVYQIDGKLNTTFVDRYFRAGVTSYRVRHVYTDGTYSSWMTGTVYPCHRDDQCHIAYRPQHGSLRE